MKIQFLVEENTFRFDRTRKFEFSKILSRGNRSKFIIRIILLNISDDKIRQRWKLISVRENVNLENKVSRIARISGLRHSLRSETAAKIFSSQAYYRNDSPRLTIG